MARAFLRGEPLGQRIQLGTEPDTDPANPYMEVVGVVGDVRSSRTRKRRPRCTCHTSSIRIRSSGVCSPTSSSSFARRATRRAWVPRCARSCARPTRINPSPTSGRCRTCSHVGGAATIPDAAARLLCGDRAHAGGDRDLRTALARRGAARERVRLAHGARRGTLGRAAARAVEGATLALIGVGIGLVAAMAAVGFLRSVLYGVSPWDPLAGLIGRNAAGRSLLATWIPRAGRCAWIPSSR